MPLATLLTQTCTITSRSSSGDVDDYGNDLDTVTTLTVDCELQQTVRTEPGDQGEMSRTDWLLILPADTTLDTGDHVTVEGRGYEVVGDPWQARNPRTDAQSHVEATLRRTHGEEHGS